MCVDRVLHVMTTHIVGHETHLMAEKKTRQKIRFKIDVFNIEYETGKVFNKPSYYFLHRMICGSFNMILFSTLSHRNIGPQLDRR